MSQSSGERPRQPGTGMADSGAAALATLRIGEWDADRAMNRLRRPGRSVRLEPKAMELLFFLAGRAGQVVSRDELLAVLWPGLIVGDDALTQAMIKLRRALGDRPRSPAYIETVPKRGYRLIARVGAAEAEAPAEAAAPGRRPARLWPAIAVAAVGALVGIEVLLHRAAVPVIGGGAASAAANRPTVLVMPFEALGDHPEQRYLARGLAAELATDLTRLSGLITVRADAAADPARGLGPRASAAAFQVWGAVQRTRDRITVQVRLIETATGWRIWARRYDRPFGDLFAIEHDIQRRLAEALSVRITEAERVRSAGRYSRSMDAYEHYLHARAALLAGSERHRGEGRELLRRSISLDPGFAPAYGRLALLHTGEYHQRRYGRGAAALARALEMARTAVEMDPSLPEAHWVLAYVSTQRRRHDEALAHLERALTVAPSFADAFALKAGIKTYVGEPEASIGLLDVALQLRPAASHHHFLLLGRARFFLDDLDQAARDLRKALERNPASLEARIYLAATLHRNGDQEGARWEAEEIRAIEPGFAAGNWLDSYPMTDARQIQHLVSALRSLGL